MLAPYTRALKMPRCRLSLPLVKSDTVIGTIGNTQGVTSAAKPNVKASKAKRHRPPAWPTGSTAPVAAATGGAGATAAPEAGPVVAGLAGTAVAAS